MRKITLSIGVILSFIACEEITQVTDISKEEVSVLAPTEGVILTESSANFSWDGVTDAENYHLQIAKPSFENAVQIVEDTLVSKLNFTTVLVTGNYQWRVSAQNSGYATNYTVTAFVVQTETIDISGESITLSTPADEAVFATSESIDFSWETIANAQTYILQIASPDFSDQANITTEKEVTEATYTASGLTAVSYQWRVKAVNSAFETAYTTQKFTVN